MWNDRIGLALGWSLFEKRPRKSHWRTEGAIRWSPITICAIVLVSLLPHMTAGRAVMVFTIGAVITAIAVLARRHTRRPVA